MRPSRSVKREPDRRWIPSDGIAMLRQIQRAIRRRPSSYRQDRWHCGTAMCLAGQAAMMSGLVTRVKKHPVYDEMTPVVKRGFGPVIARFVRHGGTFFLYLPEWPALGAVALGISASSAERLFSGPNSWPEPFRSRYTSQPRLRDRAQVACERIDHFIETGA